MLFCDWLVFNSCDWPISILVVSMICSLGGLLPYGSPVVVGVHASGISTVPIDVVRVKFYVNRLFDPACVTMKITINIFYFIPKRMVSSVVGVL